ncbi:hypothetical protein QYF61_013690 [Mycteria americana]|uniref:Uncharacterized protein n=1 Tax=Mycteria americana TaxID=33587 RepID=A0AAN7NEA4_MYCAM|nr:hypothetical protein QYF61_013690 [Mycteria americana]
MGNSDCLAGSQWEEVFLLGVRKAKADLELSLARDLKGNKRRFYKYINSKRMTKENISLLLNGNK